MSKQLRLFGEASEDGAEQLLLNATLQACVDLLSASKRWPGGALALIGPEGAGKSTLAGAWAAQARAGVVAPNDGPRDLERAFAAHAGRLLLEEAAARSEAVLTLALDLARLEGGAVLLTARTPPAEWRAQSPDLRSRLAALATATLEEPDLELLAGLLRRFCRRRFLELPEEVARYCALRMPRRAKAAADLAEALDEAAHRACEPISMETARRALRLAFPSELPDEENPMLFRETAS